jgi:hypothetical protein
VAFFVLMLLGAVLALFLLDSKKIRRYDGSHIIVMKQPTWKSEFIGLWEVAISDYYIFALFPMFLSSNWFYEYHFNNVNLAKFSVRTRALNNVLYWTAQIIGSFIWGFALDYKGISRTLKAKISLAGLFVLTMAIWGGGYAFQKTYTRAQYNASLPPPNGTNDPSIETLDWAGPGYIGPMFLYFFYGIFDAVWQTNVYW